MRYFLFFFLILFLSCVVPSFTAGVLRINIDKRRYTSNSGAYKLKWNIDCDRGELDVVVTASGTGWVAFGFNSALLMPNAYILQAHVTNGIVDYRVAKNGDYSAPSAVNDLVTYTNVNGTQTNTETIIGFTRLLDVAAPEYTILPEGNKVIWAFQPSNDDYNSMHTVRSRGAVNINFFTGTASAPKVTNYALIHGSIMLVAWAFLAPAGTFVARYLKAIGHPWYLIHISIQYIVLGLTIASFVIIEKYIGTSRHFRNPHSIIGLTIVILTLIQVVMGIISNAMFKADRKSPPIFPDKVHWYLGRLVILYAISNCFVGLDQYGFSKIHNQPFIAFAVWMAIVIVLFVITEIKSGQVHHVQIDASDDKLSKVTANKFTVVMYIMIFVVGIIMYGVTMSQMWDF